MANGTKYIEGSLNISGNNTVGGNETVTGNISATGSVTSTSNPLEVVANRVSTIPESTTNDSTTYPSVGAVRSAISTAIQNLPEFMYFKGTVGTNGTITWSDLPNAAAANEGWTYKVITAHAADAKVATATKVGDTIISNGTTWNVIPSGDDVEDTWRNIKVNGTEILGTGISTGYVNFKNGGNITLTATANSSDITLGVASGYSIPSTTDQNTWTGKQDALATQTAYSAKGTSTKVPQITTNSLGQVTLIEEKDIPIYNKTLTIQKNGTQVATFTANSNTDVTANITVPTKVSDLTNDSGFLTAESDTLGTVLNRGNSATTDINFNNKDWYNAGTSKTAYSYSTNQNPNTQYYWFKITPPASNGTDRYYLCVENDVNYPTYRGTYLLDISNYSNGTSYNVSLNNLGTTAPSNATTNKLLNVAIDASGNVYVQARATWTSYLRFIRTGGTTTQSYPYASGSADTSKAAFGTVAGFTSLKMISETGCIRLKSGGVIDSDAGTTGKTTLWADDFIEGGTKLSSKYLQSHPTITINNNETATPAQLAAGNTFTAITEMTKDSNGHVQKYKTTTYTLPAKSSHKVISGLNRAGTANLTGTASSGDLTLPDSGATAGSYGPDSNKTPSPGNTFSVPQVTINAKGIVTGIAGYTITLPSKTTHTVNSGKKKDGTTDIKTATASNGDIVLGDSGVTANAYGDSGAQTPGYGSTFKVPYIRVNAKGIVTEISEHTVKIPASDNTDHNDNQTIKGNGTAFGANDAVNIVGSGGTTVTAATSGTGAPKITISSPSYTLNSSTTTSAGAIEYIKYISFSNGTLTLSTEYLKLGS